MEILVNTQIISFHLGPSKPIIEFKGKLAQGFSVFWGFVELYHSLGQADFVARHKVQKAVGIYKRYKSG